MAAAGVMRGKATGAEGVIAASVGATAALGVVKGVERIDEVGAVELTCAGESEALRTLKASTLLRPVNAYSELRTDELTS